MEEILHQLIGGVRPGQTRILLLDYHQVLDRAVHSTSYDTGVIPPANVATVERSVDFAAGKDISLFVFVLSYTVDRIQNILDTLESTPDRPYPTFVRSYHYSNGLWSFRQVCDHLVYQGDFGRTNSQDSFD